MEWRGGGQTLYLRRGWKESRSEAFRGWSEAASWSPHLIEASNTVQAKVRLQIYQEKRKTGHNQSII